MRLKLDDNSDTRRRSGGPRTKAGKARSARNSTKHGIHSSAWRLPEEDWQPIQELIDGVMSALDPQDQVEKELARRIAFCFLRMRRVETYENAAAVRVADLRERLAILRQTFADTPKDHLHAIDPRDARILAVLPDLQALDKLTRWDSHATRQLKRAMDELRAYRAMQSA